jgi:protein-S-isoprenylcysteine O-methyltransferase Ste14
VNLLLLSLFAIQHTIMARPVFKVWFTKIVPEPAERPTFVLLASLILCLMYWQWRPMPEVIWQTDNTALANGLIGMSLFGFLIVLYATFIINHFDLFGLRQVWLYFKGVEYTPVEFKINSLYKIVRNPLMTGFLIGFWFTPNLTQAHLLFAVVTTGYIFFGVFLEERDAAKALGKEYLEYRSKTPMLIPFLKFGGGSAEESTRDTSESK